MKIIAPCFSETTEFASPLINSLKKFSPQYYDNLILYGVGLQNGDFYYTKMEKACETLKSISDKVVALVDAFDTIVNKPLENLEEDFKKKNCKLLISGEANCFPYTQYEKFLSEKSDTDLKIWNLQ